MNHTFLALAFQGADNDFSMWIIIVVVLVILFFIVLVIAVGLAIFFIARKRRKAEKLAANPAMGMSSGAAPAYEQMSSRAVPESAGVLDQSPPAFELPPQVPATPFVNTPEESFQDSEPGASDFDPSRTVAITREKTVTISYGTIKFTSGVLAGQQFEVKPEGAYIGREASLSQIIVSDPRISKRHLWLGVREGLVKIVDQDSRNGTFLNDPKSERVTEAMLNPGDTVILGESDVARFEYQL